MGRLRATVAGLRLSTFGIRAVEELTSSPAPVRKGSLPVPETMSKYLLPLLSLPLTAGAVLADLSQEPHLSPLPRTASEAARIDAVRAAPKDFTAPQKFEVLPAGAGTVLVRGGAALFAQPAANLTDTLDFELGRSLFEKLWVAAPSSTRASDGLGPVYNARACSGCHINDGRGHAPAGPEDDAKSFALKLSVPAPLDERAAEIASWIATAPEPNYGGQIQDFATANIGAEARLSVSYSSRQVTFEDGAVLALRQPEVALEQMAHGALHPDVMLSPRIAPPISGLGLIEAIPAADILALADPEDSNGDGISGRAAIAWSVEYDRWMLGRFGHKASQPTLRQQVAAALSTDLGLSTPLFPAGWGDCTEAQTKCRAAPHGDRDVRVHEVDDIALDLMTLYTANLGVPKRRNVDSPEVLRGKEIFHQAGCQACHTPNFVTHRLNETPERSFQLIWPYSDFLLHDMGEGLRDSRPEGIAGNQEWRTPPLWGIGLAQAASPEAGFLHDGRARTLLEAVMWHGGEAARAQNHIRQLPASDRDALIAFLESL
ncbi:putative thiol oxidoreductase [Thalassovita autumnalis]|uniref:Thiol oxidoreductase n=2 Tax=Thalassovita autumnalis TaxID=2072972 RepID=A0A0P1F8R5_9RHOB|nr:putative thiol oxidoreductase [Thalassovita autumnalis]CUH71632.1 putative thiol oxidoreductase [Thalassovita autumnalis]